MLVDYTTEITNIKNDYVTNAGLDARHKDSVQKATFKSELKKVDDKASENSSKVLSHEHKLKQRKDTINDLEGVTSYFREVKIILIMIMAHKIIYCFNQCTNVLKHLLNAVLLMFLHANQKDCLMKKLVLFPHLDIIKFQD